MSEVRPQCETANNPRQTKYLELNMSLNSWMMSDKSCYWLFGVMAVTQHMRNQINVRHIQINSKTTVILSLKGKKVKLLYYDNKTFYHFTVFIGMFQILYEALNTGSNKEERLETLDNEWWTLGSVCVRSAHLAAQLSLSSITFQFSNDSTPLTHSSELCTVLTVSRWWLHTPSMVSDWVWTSELKLLHWFTQLVKQTPLAEEQLFTPKLVRWFKSITFVWLEDFSGPWVFPDWVHMLIKSLKSDDIHPKDKILWFCYIPQHHIHKNILCSENLFLSGGPKSIFASWDS